MASHRLGPDAAVWRLMALCLRGEDDDSNPLKAWRPEPAGALL
jgi:hypothetical protein